MRPFTVGIAALIVTSGIHRAAAKCADPRGCFTDLCTVSGTVVELTVTEASPRGEVARVDAIHVASPDGVPGDASGAPALVIGEEVALMTAQEVGARLVGIVAAGAKTAWPVFALSEEGEVSCLVRPAAFSLTVAELVTLVSEGACAEGSPIAEPPGECDDHGGCAASPEPALLALALLALRTRRGRATPRPPR